MLSVRGALSSPPLPPPPLLCPLPSEAALPNLATYLKCQNIEEQIALGSLAFGIVYRNVVSHKPNERKVVAKCTIRRKVWQHWTRKGEKPDATSGAPSLPSPEGFDKGR